MNLFEFTFMLCIINICITIIAVSIAVRSRDKQIESLKKRLHDFECWSDQLVDHYNGHLKEYHIYQIGEN